MRIHPINELPSTIILGRQTETGVTEVRLDCAEWLALWPELKISVLVTPPGGNSVYEAQTHMESDVLVWTVNGSDTAVAGSGMMEVLGVADGQRKLSAIATTRVLATTTITQGEAPDALPRAICTAAPNAPHQQLVSDAEGKAVWVPALAYKTTDVVTILSERTGTPEGEGEVGIAEPFEGVVEADKTYKVNYNGTEYESTGVAMEMGNTPDGETIKGVVLGNTAFVGGEDNGLPFVVIYVEPQFQEYTGAYGVILAADGATSVTISITQEGTAYKTINEEYLPASAVRKPITLTVATDDTVTADTDFNTAWAMGAQALMDAIVIKQVLADGTRTITPDNVELFENETGLQYIYIRYSSFYYNMADQSQIPDRGRWMLWHANALQIQNGILPGFNPMNLRTSGTAQAGDYVRHEGNGLLRLVSIDQLKADLGLTSGETTTEDVFYTSDGQTFTTLDGAVLHVQKGEE